jgi:PTH1 family peptidyl-tRNA hydrolase
VALPFGTIRIRAKGGDAGHNGLKHINQILETTAYPRVRFGIGDNYSQGQQVNYVLGQWTDEEQSALSQRIEKVHDVIHAYVTIGLERTMNQFNNK